MAKKPLAKDQDKFIVRLPDGMRDRIKAKADLFDISMNEAVVMVLERAFPPPATMEEKLSELIELTAALKGDDSYHLVAKLVNAIDETLEDVSKYKIKARPRFRDMVADRYERIKEEEQERLRDYYENQIDFSAGKDDPFSND